MNRKALTLGMVLALVAGPAMAEDGASREESIGVGVGAVIGGLAGGPIGAILGAGVGAKIGDEFYQHDEEVDMLSASLAGSRGTVAALERDIDALRNEVNAKDGELARAREMANPEILALLQSGIELDLLFRTDEDALTGSTTDRLRQLALSIAVNPDVQVRLDGYADERGDEDYNQALSNRRVEFVRDVLVAAGVPAARISASAHGESVASEQTVDSFALERRVSLTLYVKDTPSFAANPR